MSNSSAINRKNSEAYIAPNVIIRAFLSILRIKVNALSFVNNIKLDRKQIYLKVEMVGQAAQSNFSYYFCLGLTIWPLIISDAKIAFFFLSTGLAKMLVW